MEIPVKKSSSPPWWFWLIAGLLLLGVLWWLFAGRNDDRAGAEAGPEISAPASSTAVVSAGAGPLGAAAPRSAEGAGGQEDDAQGVITELGTVLDATDRRALIGREFQLTGVRVLDVVGDRTFWVGDGPSRRVFAALREVPPPGWPTDADIDINSRQTVSVRGVVRDAASGELNGRPLQNMPAGTDVVLFAQTAEVLKRP